MLDPWKVLGVAEGASIEEIRRRYLRAAATHHPDRHAGAGPDAHAEALARMQEINLAYAILTDPDERQRWERAQRASAPRDPSRAKEGVTVRRVPPDDSRPPDDAGRSAADRATRDPRQPDEPPPVPLTVRVLDGFFDGPGWVAVYAPDGMAGRMHLDTGETVIDREDLRPHVLRLLQEFVRSQWA